MQRTERPRDTERGDGSTSATAERTSSLRLPWLQHALRALRPNRETDPERSPDWRSITRAPVQASPGRSQRRRAPGKRLLHCGISIPPMTAVGHLRRMDPLATRAACPLRPDCDRVAAPSNPPVSAISRQNVVDLGGLDCIRYPAAHTGRRQNLVTPLFEQRNEACIDQRESFRFMARYPLSGAARKVGLSLW
jgi:hypothetical protein